MIKKYFKTKSATFWIGMMPIAGGLIEIVDAFIPLGYLSAVTYAMFGDAQPFTLIMAGAGTITMRAALK